jgi:hypothetical protein
MNSIFLLFFFFFFSIYAALLGRALVSFVIKLVEANALVDSFFCMVSNASDLTIVKTWNGAILLPARTFLGM